MRLSVIVPVLNEERVIEARLRELQAFSIDEVIVVDGGSHDDTRAIVARQNGVKLATSRRGRALQMNVGATLATGDVFLFLHADVSLPSDALPRIEEALASPRVVAGAFRTWTVADRPTRLGWLLHLADIRSRVTGLPYGDQALFVRAKAFRQLGGFPELPLMEDLELSLRLRTVGEVRIVRSSVLVSGRRFIDRPLFYTGLMNIYPTLYRAGVPPSLLARFYEAVR